MGIVRKVASEVALGGAAFGLLLMLGCAGIHAKLKGWNG